MEVEKKRKRGENGKKSNGGESGGGRRKTEREMTKGEKVESSTSTPPPTEEEVEEFFSILRRMHAAVKYFENSNSNGAGHKLSGRWATALEKEVLRGVNGVHLRNEGVARNRNVVFDLNAVPEAESNSSV